MLLVRNVPKFRSAKVQYGQFKKKNNTSHLSALREPYLVPESENGSRVLDDIAAIMRKLITVRRISGVKYRRGRSNWTTLIQRLYI